jgi:FAD/FMN-containing dehydrogenase
MFEGASNADGGITINLKHLDTLELSEDGQTARVGPGQRWGRVYEFFEEKGKVVVGGRVTVGPTQTRQKKEKPPLH